VLCTIELPPRARVARHNGERVLPSLEASQEVGRERFLGGRTLALAVRSVIACRSARSCRRWPR
jgi:hypothetical protein